MFWFEMLLYWSELVYIGNISIFQDVVNQLLWLNSHIKYNKTVLYALSFIQQSTMLIKDILNADLNIPTPIQFNATFSLEWQEDTYDNLTSAIPIE